MKKGKGKEGRGWEERNKRGQKDERKDGRI